jgi:hypothetical protein
MVIVGVNVWTGGPLVALWIGSRVQQKSGGSLTIRPLTAIAVFVSLIAITWVLAKLLALVARAYDRAQGVTATRQREHAKWLRSERPPNPGDRPPSTMLERILVAVVVLAALTFEVWFFFFSTSPIDGRTGRSQVPVASVTPRRLEPVPLLAPGVGVVVVAVQLPEAHAVLAHHLQPA